MALEDLLRAVPGLSFSISNQYVVANFSQPFSELNGANDVADANLQVSTGAYSPRGPIAALGVFVNPRV